MNKAWLKELLFEPEKTVEKTGEGFRKPLKLAAASGAAFGFLLSSFLMALGFIGPQLVVAGTFGGIVLGLIGPAISAATVHPFIYYFGGRSYEHTYKVFALHAPLTVAGAIPVINFLVVPTVLALEARALIRVHGLEPREGALAVSLPGTALVVIGYLVLEFLRTTGYLAGFSPV